MNTLSCDVVILPSEELTRKTIISSQKLAQLDSKFTLEIGKFFPHVSLFMLQVDLDDINKVKNIIATIAHRTNIIELKASHYNQSFGYLDVEYGKNEQLTVLQNQVVTKLNPLRSGMSDGNKVRMLNASGIALGNFQEYGYKYIGKLFRPHITFTCFGKDQPDAENLLPKVSSFDGLFVKLGLFEVGDNDTCIRKIAEYDL